MLFAAAMWLALAQTQSGADPAAAERARARVAARCRIDADRLSVERVAPDLAGLVLKGDGPLSDAQLRCYGDALTDGDLYPSIENERLSRRYDRLVRLDMHANARGFLRRRGLLERVPRRLRSEPLGHFARRLERFCGVPLRSVLRVEGGRMTLAETGETRASPGDPGNWLCTYYAAVVAGYDPVTVPPPVPTPVPDTPAPGG